jgi:hypothetical protein
MFAAIRESNLKRHILNKHSMNPAVHSYIGYVNSKLEKVVPPKWVDFSVWFWFFGLFRPQFKTDCLQFGREID